MNIGFFLIPYQRYSGAGQYYHNLFSRLIQIDTDNTYKIFLPRDIDKTAIDFFGKERCIITEIPSGPGPVRYLRMMTSRCVENYRPRISLLHCFNFPLPPFSGKTILTIYDLRESDLPHVYGPIHSFFSSKIKPFALKRVEHVITISDFSAQRIIHHYPYCKNKISRIYLGFEPPNQVLHIRPHTRPYILTVGHITRHKNHETLIKAFNILARNPDFIHDLIIVGHHYNNLNYLKELKELVENKSRVIFAGQVSEEKNEALYAYADLFAFPSLYEGFGLPLIEAFHFGVPVVASRIPTFQELYGIEAALFNPLDPFDCARVIKMVLSNREFKENIINKAHLIAGKYSCKITAQETLALYNKLQNQ